MNISKENKEFLNTLILDLTKKVKTRENKWTLYGDGEIRTKIDSFKVRIMPHGNRMIIKIDDDTIFEDTHGLWWRTSLGRNASKLRDLVEKEVRYYNTNKKIDELRENELISKLAGLK